MPVDLKGVMLLAKTYKTQTKETVTAVRELAQNPTDVKMRLSRLQAFLEDTEPNALGLTFSDHAELVGIRGKNKEVLRDMALSALKDVLIDSGDLSSTPMVLLSSSPVNAVTRLRNETYQHWYRDYGSLLTAIAMYSNYISATPEIHNMLTATAVNAFAKTSPNTPVAPNTHATMIILHVLQQAIEDKVMEQRGVQSTKPITVDEFKNAIQNIDATNIETVEKLYRHVYKGKPIKIDTESGVPIVTGGETVSRPLGVTSYPEPILVASHEGLRFMKRLVETGQPITPQAVADAFETTFYETYPTDANKTFSYAHNVAKSVLLVDENTNRIETLADLLSTKPTLTRDTWEASMSSYWLRRFFNPDGTLNYNAINTVALQAGVTVDETGVHPIENVWNDQAQREEIMRLYNLREKTAGETPPKIGFQSGSKRFYVFRQSTYANPQNEVVKSWKKAIDGLNAIRQNVIPNDFGGVDIRSDFLGTNTAGAESLVNANVAQRIVDNGIVYYRFTEDALRTHGKQFNDLLHQVATPLKKAYQSLGTNATTALMETYSIISPEIASQLEQTTETVLREMKRKQIAQHRQTVSEALLKRVPVKTGATAVETFQPQEIQACLWTAWRKLSANYFGFKSDKLLKNA